MKFELLSGAHSVGEANYHLQFTPAYRRDIFADEAVRILDVEAKRSAKTPEIVKLYKKAIFEKGTDADKIAVCVVSAVLHDQMTRCHRVHNSTIRKWSGIFI